MRGGSEGGGWLSIKNSEKTRWAFPEFFLSIFRIVYRRRMKTEGWKKGARTRGDSAVSVVKAKNYAVIKPSRRFIDVLEDSGHSAAQPPATCTTEDEGYPSAPPPSLLFLLCPMISYISCTRRDTHIYIYTSVYLFIYIHIERKSHKISNRREKRKRDRPSAATDDQHGRQSLVGIVYHISIYFFLSLLFRLKKKMLRPPWESVSLWIYSVTCGLEDQFVIFLLSRITYRLISY